MRIAVCTPCRGPVPLTGTQVGSWLQSASRARGRAADGTGFASASSVSCPSESWSLGEAALGFTDVGAAGTLTGMASVTIEGLPEESLTASMLRVASDPLQRARFYELLGDYCHQCRNTLNSLKLSLYLARRGLESDRPAPWTDLELGCRAVEEFIERLQWIIKPIAPALVRLPLTTLMDDYREAWSEAMSSRGRTLEWFPPDQAVAVAFDPFHLGKALDALVRWRAKEGPAGEPVRLQWGVEGDQAYLELIEQRASNEHLPDSRIESLALPVVARIAVAHGGTVSVDARDGLRVGLRWPIDASSSKEEHP